MNGLGRDLLVYYGYKATTARSLYHPIMFLYFRSIGLSWGQIALLEAAGSLTTVLTEVPTGFVGDRVGRLRALVVGTALITVSMGVIAFAESFFVLAAVYPVWSIGWNLRSGNDSAWFYDRLAAAGQSDRFADRSGRAKALTRTVGVGGALLGGYLGTLDLAAPFLAAGILSALGIPALLVLGRTDRHYVRDGPSPRESVGLVRDALTLPRLRYFVPYYFVCIAGVLAVVFMFAQPVVEAHAATVGYDSSVELLLGGLYAGISLVSAGLSYHTGVIAERIGLRRWFSVVPVAVGLGLLGLSFVPALVLPAILLARGVADVTGTLAGQYVNDQLGGTGRATVLSAMRMVRKLADIPFLLAAGWAADAGLATSEVLALAGLGLLVGVAALGRWTFSRFAVQSSSSSGRSADAQPDR
ncbi:MFS transporter [Halovivax limisalsi]|uniref:MFS transporter n=1 Tax=Halovivax limisalsi TaxID=1453760 RepID=UPI001FFD1CF2|nr:MFS transporter [Halovivax limisalsi]